MNDELYTQHILDHCMHPRHRGVMSTPHSALRSVNRNCGDDLILFIRTEEGIITEVSFDGVGCALCIAGASMLTDYITKRPVLEVERLTESDMVKLFGVPIGEGRKNCALLAFRSLRTFIESHA